MLFFAGRRANLPASIRFIVTNRSDKGATKEDKSGVTEVMIILRLDRVMADRKMSLNELAEKVGIANVNLSKIKTGKISAIRFSTLDAICKALSCQPGDILEYRNDGHTSDPK
jgi:DNA-binding protein